MGTVETIKIARRTGFCYGVREAIDKAKEASAAGKSTHTLGQVVHNEGVVADLERRGIEVIDGTCTWVIQEHRELVKLVDEGYTIVLLGTPNHAEVVGMLGFAPD